MPGDNERPALLLSLLTALVPLTFAASLFELFVAPKQIVAHLAAALVAAVWLLRRSVALPATVVWAPIAGLALAATLSAARSSNPSVSLEASVQLLLYATLLPVSLSVFRRAEARSMLVTALMAAGVVEAALVLLQFAHGDPIFPAYELSGKWRTFGTFGNPNWAGEFLALAALVTMGRLDELAESKAGVLQRHATAACLLLVLFSLAATLARAAYLAWLIGAAVFTALRGRRLWKVTLAAAVPFALILLALFILNRQDALAHLSNVDSIKGRYWLWSIAWSMIRSHPVLGFGPGTFRLHFPVFQADTFSQPGSAAYTHNAGFTSWAHNDFLQVWIELGAVGVACLLFLVWAVLRRGRALAKDPAALGCWAAFISLVVNSLFAFPLYLPASLTMFLVLVGAVEAAACSRWILIRPPRMLAAALAFALSIAACWSSFHLAMTEFALQRAEIALARRRWDAAETAAANALRYGPRRLESHLMAGRLHVARGEYALALTALGRAAELGFNIDVYEQKATALTRSGRTTAAIETLEQLLRLRPDLAWPRGRLAALKHSDTGGRL